MNTLFPTLPAPADLQIGSVQPSRLSVSQSMKRSVRTTGAQLWTLKARWAPLTRSQFAPIQAFVLAQRGRAGVFTWRTPLYPAPIGVATGTPVVTGAGQTGTLLMTSGWSPSVPGILKAGDVFSIAGQPKVYMVMEDANSNSNGESILSIQPSLLISPAAAAPLTVNHVPFTLSLSSDLMEAKITKGALFQGEHPYGLLFSFALELIEAI
ncbi:MAG: hypothetical protein HQL80_03555 [Magnetococcales bacterium]|nr:hypothetical protein [Magnetococcales bacterium]